MDYKCIINRFSIYVPRMGFQIIEWISDRFMDFGINVRRMDSRSIFDWMFGLRFWGWVSWIFHGVTTEEVTFDYVDRAVLIVLVIFERLSSCGYSIDFRSI